MWSGGLDAGARIACALLEYGEQIESGRLSGGSGTDAVSSTASDDKQLAKAQKAAAKADQEAAARSAEMQSELLAQMSGGPGMGKLSGARVGDVMSLQADTLRAEIAPLPSLLSSSLSPSSLLPSSLSSSLSCQPPAH